MSHSVEGLETAVFSRLFCFYVKGKDVIMQRYDGLSIPCFHGSRKTIAHPDLSYSRNDVDFGIGFYMTSDETMAKKWACNKNSSFLNTYALKLEGLKIHTFEPDEEWLEYCAANRYQENSLFDDSDYDVLIGPTADDKLFNTLDMYADGLLSTEEAIKVINCMKYSNQIVVKKQIVIDECLVFKGSKELRGQEKDYYITLFRQDRMDANKKTEEMIRSLKRRGRIW